MRPDQEFNTRWVGIVWTALYEPWIMERDEKISYRLNGLGVKVDIEHSYLLHRPDEVVVKNTSF